MPSAGVQRNACCAPSVRSELPATCPASLSATASLDAPPSVPRSIITGTPCAAALAPMHAQPQAINIRMPRVMGPP